MDDVADACEVHSASQSGLHMFIRIRNLVVGVQMHHDHLEDLRNDTAALICQSSS